MYVLEFQISCDMLKVKNECPLMLDWHLLFLKDFDNYTLWKTCFDTKLFCVQLHHLPCVGMNQSVEEKVDSISGDVKMVDLDSNGRVWGKYLRVWV